MKLLIFHKPGNGRLRLGIKAGDHVIDVAAAALATGHRDVPTSMNALIGGGTPAASALKSFTEQLPKRAEAPWRLKSDDVRYGPCVVHPEKILCIGLNYRRHARESDLPVPEVPVLFSKFNNALAGSGQVIPLPHNASEYDYEVELGIVIGKIARHVSVENALDHVFGYCVVNDLSARDLQGRTSQWLLGKTLDMFMPTGPHLVTADEVGDPQALRLRCWVNGELRQDSSTSDMVFSVAESISYISQYMTLKPGDLISTGTPEGVIFGRTDRAWLQPGDEITAEIDKVGRLTNVMAEDGQR